MQPFLTEMRGDALPCESCSRASIDLHVAFAVQGVVREPLSASRKSGQSTSPSRTTALSHIAAFGARQNRPLFAVQPLIFHSYLRLVRFPIPGPTSGALPLTGH